MVASVWKQIRNTAGIAALAIAAASPAYAFTLDGRETAGEYSGADVFDVEFLLTGADLSFDTTDGIADGDVTVGGGTLKVGRIGPGGDIFALLTVPISIVDLVYGLNGTGSPTDTTGSGWDTGTAGSPAHPLEKLMKSDKFEFKLPVNGSDAQVSIDLVNDNLLPKVDKKGVLQAAGTGAAGAVATVLANGAGSVVGASSSLVWNLTGKDFTGGGAGVGDARLGDGDGFYGEALQLNNVEAKNNPSVSPDPLDPDPLDPLTLAGDLPPSDWIQAVQYEVQFDGAKFTGDFPGPAAWTMMSLHASPNKLSGKNLIYIACVQIVGGPATTCVPSSGPPASPPGVAEPGTLAMFSVGLVVLGLRRRRQAAVARG